jgi:hypothetical protein
METELTTLKLEGENLKNFGAIVCNYGLSKLFELFQKHDYEIRWDIRQ